MEISEAGVLLRVRDKWSQGRRRLSEDAVGSQTSAPSSGAAGLGLSVFISVSLSCSQAESCGDLQALCACTFFLPGLVVLMGKNVHCLRLDLPDVLPSDEKTLSGPGNWSLD